MQNIIINTLENKSLVYSEQATSLLDLQDFIEQKVGIPQKEQRLVLNNRVELNEQNFEQYQKQQNDLFVDLRLSLLGGVPQKSYYIKYDEFYVTVEAQRKIKAYNLMLMFQKELALNAEFRRKDSESPYSLMPLIGSLQLYVNDRLLKNNDYVQVTQADKIEVKQYKVKIVSDKHTFDIGISLDQDLEVLKKKINQYYRGTFPPARQILIHEGREMLYRAKFSMYEIEAETEIELQKNHEPPNQALIGAAIILFTLQLVGTFAYWIIGILLHTEFATGGVALLSLRIWGQIFSFLFSICFFQWMDDYLGSFGIPVFILFLISFAMIAICGFGQKEPSLIKCFVIMYLLTNLASLALIFLDRKYIDTFYENEGYEEVSSTQFNTAFIMQMVFSFLSLIIYFFAQRQIQKANDFEYFYDQQFAIKMDEENFNVKDKQQEGQEGEALNNENNNNITLTVGDQSDRQMIQEEVRESDF